MALIGRLSVGVMVMRSIIRLGWTGVRHSAPILIFRNTFRNRRKVMRKVRHESLKILEYDVGRKT